MKIYYLLYAILKFNLCISLKFEHKYFQNKYKITLEKALITSFNTDLIDAKFINYKYNRTTATANFTIQFKEDINKMRVEVIASKFSVNVYARTAIQLNADLCMLLKSNAFSLQQVKTNGNFTNCPINQGLYVFNNFYILGEDFPPNLPEGRWKLELNIKTNRVFGFIVEIYLSIVYPIV